MEGCVVCCKSNEDRLSRITTSSKEWKEWHIQRIIEKHLWWWYLRQPCNKGADQWICLQCWYTLSSFHSFCNNVKEENKLYEKTLLQHVKIDKDEEMAVSIKTEQVENASTLTEEMLVPLEKPKRGRRKKNTDEKTASIHVMELATVQVKYEVESNEFHETLIAEPSLDMLQSHDTETDSIGWEPNFLDEHTEITWDENEDEVLENDKLELGSKRKLKQKVRTKTKAVTKYRKKYTKSKKEKKIKLRPTTDNSNFIKVMRKNDQFIADNQFQLACSICSESLSNFNNLKSHFRKEHDILGYAMCCNKKFYKRGLLVDHLSVHKDPEYFKCPQCNKALSTRRSYEKHMETHQLNATQQHLFTCDKCDKSFLKKPVFERHVLTHVPEEERNFQCSLCNKKFASEYLRNQHCTLTHKKKYAKICDICGKQLRDSFSFIRHMAEHKGETPAKVKCDICGAELTNKYRLNRHIKMMHTEENQQEQICPYCSKVSPNLNAHRHHVKYTHTLERKHACNMCDKKFRRPLELKEHLSTHTGEPLYTCPHCPRTFISSGNMHKHRKLTHRKEWEEGRMKREAKALAVKKFLQTMDVNVTPENESLYPDLDIIGTEAESEANLSAFLIYK